MTGRLPPMSRLSFRTRPGELHSARTTARTARRCREMLRGGREIPEPSREMLRGSREIPRTISRDAPRISPDTQDHPARCSEDLARYPGPSREMLRGSREIPRTISRDAPRRSRDALDHLARCFEDLARYPEPSREMLGPSRDLLGGSPPMLREAHAMVCESHDIGGSDRNHDGVCRRSSLVRANLCFPESGRISFPEDLMRKHLLSLAIAVAILGDSVSAAACVTDFYSSQYNHFTAAFQGSLIKDFNDYALIFEDAKTPDCSATARDNLYTKITTTGWHSDALGRWVPPYMGFLEGNQVALIYAAALMIGGNGDLNSNLDWALSGGSRGYGPRSYQYNPGPGCGWQSSGWLNGGDTCMEEHAAAAAAYAWIAAYESKRYGYWSASSHAYNASAHIDAALSTGDSICIYNPNNQTDPAGRGPCNVDVSGMSEADAYGTLQPILTPDPNTGRTIADVLSFNRGEKMVYGAGQLTILNAALIG